LIIFKRYRDSRERMLKRRDVFERHFLKKRYAFPHPQSLLLISPIHIIGHDALFHAPHALSSAMKPRWWKK